MAKCVLKEIELIIYVLVNGAPLCFLRSLKEENLFP